MMYIFERYSYFDFLLLYLVFTYWTTYFQYVMVNEYSEYQIWKIFANRLDVDVRKLCDDNCVLMTIRNTVLVTNRTSVFKGHSFTKPLMDSIHALIRLRCLRLELDNIAIKAIEPAMLMFLKYWCYSILIPCDLIHQQTVSHGFKDCCLNSVTVWFSFYCILDIHFVGRTRGTSKKHMNKAPHKWMIYHFSNPWDTRGAYALFTSNEMWPINFNLSQCISTDLSSSL